MNINIFFRNGGFLSFVGAFHMMVDINRIVNKLYIDISTSTFRVFREQWETFENDTRTHERRKKTPFTEKSSGSLLSCLTCCFTWHKTRPYSTLANDVEKWRRQFTYIHQMCCILREVRAIQRRPFILPIFSLSIQLARCCLAEHPVGAQPRIAPTTILTECHCYDWMHSSVSKHIFQYVFFVFVFVSSLAHKSELFSNRFLHIVFANYEFIFEFVCQAIS